MSSLGWANQPTGPSAQEKKAQSDAKAKAKAEADAAAKAKADALVQKQTDIDALGTESVSNRIQKKFGATQTERQKDIISGSQFGEAVVGEGLGRLADDPTVTGMEAQAAEMAKGFSSQEMMARREKGTQQIQGSTQAQSRATQAALARSGVKGQAAGAQLGQIAQAGLQARGDLERDLIIQDRQAKMQGLGLQGEMVGENRRFDIAQAAKEKDIALQAGLGFAQLGSVERSAKAANAAQVRAARAGRAKSCFLAGTKIQMLDGSIKNIEDIQIADFMNGGGVVYSISQSLVSEIYHYDGIKVATGHAVLENNVWIRVEDSKHAIPCEGIFPVYNLCNENHRIITECGIVFADFDETDKASNINNKESLEALNGEARKVLERGRGV